MRLYDEQNRLHAEGGPAFTNPDGSFVWYHHGKIHRLDGPAVRLVFADGRIEEQFWINGTEIVAPQL
jgi:hypothetical protein